MEFNLLEAIDNFSHNVKTWNKEVFGNIFKRKRTLLARIEGIQKAQTQAFSRSLHFLEKDLVNQFNATLFQEEVLWYQKSRNNWLTLGDNNTKFFHISTLSKRRKLKIHVLKDDCGTWISNTNDLKVHIRDHFSNLFQHDASHILDNCTNIANTRITIEENDRLSRPKLAPIGLAS
ncbi:hypothetical protein ACSBR1_000556 [Camellia fascicularis]